MLITINMTGLDRCYWIPWFARQSDGGSLWYWEAKWLGVAVSVHSRAMGCEMIRRFGNSLKAGDGE